MNFYAVLLLASIVAIIITYNLISKRIMEQKEFSGTAWGLLNGITGIGILWVIIMHNSINKKIDSIDNKKYVKYAKGQMKNFVKVYGICLGVWLIIFLLRALFNSTAHVAHF